MSLRALEIESHVTASAVSSGSLDIAKNPDLPPKYPQIFRLRCSKKHRYNVIWLLNLALSFLRIFEATAHGKSTIRTAGHFF